MNDIRKTICNMFSYINFFFNYFSFLRFESCNNLTNCIGDAVNSMSKSINIDFINEFLRGDKVYELNGGSLWGVGCVVLHLWIFGKLLILLNGAVVSLTITKSI